MFAATIHTWYRLSSIARIATTSGPAGGKVYVLDDSEVHSYTLSCNPGEDICFGAWVRGNTDKYWGVGYDNSQDCSDCCYYCDNIDTDVRNLNR